MIVRIVKLQFQEDKTEEFLTFFETIKLKVSSFPGCMGMQLLQGLPEGTIVITYSHWENEQALENYRHSDTFKQIWSTIKPWFGAGPEAWSLETVYNSFEK